MIGEHLFAARIAAPEVSAQFRRPAGHDGVDGAAMRRRHRRPMGRKIAVRKMAEDVGKLNHGREPRSEVSHQLVEELSQRGLRRLGQVSVDGGGGDVGVAEQLLDDRCFDLLLEEPGRVAVA